MTKCTGKLILGNWKFGAVAMNCIKTKESLFSLAFRYQKYICLAIIALFCFLYPHDAFAECADPDEVEVTTPAGFPVSPSTCDCEFLEAMESHAWMTAEREVVQNQNLIVKPDSVLEYTCFDDFLRVTAKYIGPIFSESQVWGLIPGQDPESLDRSLEYAVYASMVAYLELNFWHDFLGGRMEGVNHTPRSVIGGGDYTCDWMYKVWKFAKCYNFMTRDHDGFFSFENYANTPDKRELPEPCEKDPRWPEQLDRALLNPKWEERQEPYNTRAHLRVTNFLNPDHCKIAQPTGVIVQPVMQSIPGRDGFCTNPGCSYDMEAGCSP
jgi:hypothetical protein